MVAGKQDTRAKAINMKNFLLLSRSAYKPQLRRRSSFDFCVSSMVEEAGQLPYITRALSSICRAGSNI